MAYTDQGKSNMSSGDHACAPVNQRGRSLVRPCRWRFRASSMPEENEWHEIVKSIDLDVSDLRANFRAILVLPQPVILPEDYVLWRSLSLTVSLVPTNYHPLVYFSQ